MAIILRSAAHVPLSTLRCGARILTIFASPQIKYSSSSQCLTLGSRTQKNWILGSLPEDEARLEHFSAGHFVFLDVYTERIEPETKILMTTPATQFRIPKSAYTFVGPLAVLLLWFCISHFGVISNNRLASPLEVVMNLWSMVQDGSIWGHIWATFWRVLVGFGVGVLVATVLGVLAGINETVKALFDPLIQALKAVPSLAWVPLFVLWFGIDETPKIVLIALGAFFPVYVNLVAGIEGVDRKLIELSRLYHFSFIRTALRIMLPAALPNYVTGLRSGLGLAWMFVVAAEIMGASKGLGFLMVDGQQTGNAAQLISPIILFAIAGKLTDMLVLRVGNHFTAWQDVAKPKRRKGGR